MLRLLSRIFATVLVGALACGLLMRLAPGFDSDESSVDTQLSAETIAALQAERQREAELPRFFWKFLTGYFTGDLGRSRALNQPVKDLMLERAGPTLRIVTAGLVLAWLLAAAAVALAAWMPAIGRLALLAVTGAFLAVPVGLVALVLLLAGWGSVSSAIVVVGCAVFPRLARYLDQMLSAAARLPHVLTAHARGVAPAGIFLNHVLPACRAEVIALAGVSLSFAISAAIPAEVILDVAGIGQLAWQAALGRDLPLLVNVTVWITLAIVAANSLSEWASGRREPAR